MTGPGNELPERAEGRGHFRASQGDRERTIDVLKIAFAALVNTEDIGVALALITAVTAVIAASGFLGYGVIDAWQEHRSRSQLPPRTGRNGTGLEGKGLEAKGLEGKGLGDGQPSSDGRDPGWPGAYRDQTFFGRYTRRPRRDRWHASGTGARTQRSARPVLDFP
jgi:hypothetical protein